MIAPTPSSRRRVLVVAFCFPPHAAIGTFRTLRTVRHLHDTGWDVSVLTCDPSDYLPGTAVDASLIAQVPPGVRVITAGAIRPWLRLQDSVRARLRATAPGRAPGEVTGTPGAVRARRGMLGVLARAKDVIDAALAVPDRESGWIVPAIVKGVLAQAGASRPDVIYSSAPPWSGQLVAAALQQMLRCPWVADFRDPWGRAPWREDRYPFALRAAARLERLVIRRADRVVFVSHANRNEFAAHYGSGIASKFRVAPNGCDLGEFARVERPQETPATFLLLHAGSLYASRTPLPFLRAVAGAIGRGAIDPRGFRLRFLGPVALSQPALTSACDELGLSGVVEFVPRVPRAQSLAAMSSASGLLLLQPGHPVAVPAKLYDYMASGRPILAIGEGETAEIVRRSGAGIAAPSDDETLIGAALERFIELARRPFSPVDQDWYDGARRAEEISAVIGEVAGVSAPIAAIGSLRRDAPTLDPRQVEGD
jgi:glycosyltransferase involved in cell wall biosynthesis